MYQHSIDIGIENINENEGSSNVEQRITRGIRCLDPLPNEACIFRVHRELRQVNEQAYTPMLVSIGPYHHGKRELNAMEEHKKRYLDSFLERTNKSVNCYVDAMINLESRARNCYADPFELSGEKSFVELMLLDGCFVIEFLHKESSIDHSQDDPIFNQCWMKYQIYRDLMLLENQLPFFVLSKLDNISELSFLRQKEVMDPVIQMFPSAEYFMDDLISKFDESKHFLDLVHKVCHPGTVNVKEKTCWNMPCATDLEKAGVRFEANGDSAQVNMFDLKLLRKFKKYRFQTMLKIPKFKVMDSTEIFFRNIIAYEQHSPETEPKYFTDYTHFMNLLINSKEDVKQLCHHNIIENLLGDEEVVARMFNKLGDGLIAPHEIYSELCEEVNAHCDKFWNFAKAKLKRDYFNSPWASVSTIAAAFLLLLTLIQTLASLKSF